MFPVRKAVCSVTPVVKLVVSVSFSEYLWIVLFVSGVKLSPLTSIYRSKACTEDRGVVSFVLFLGI